MGASVEGQNQFWLGNTAMRQWFFAKIPLLVVGARPFARP
jgi:hypothetical protein